MTSKRVTGILLLKLRRNIADSLNPQMFHCQVCSRSEGMHKSSDAFFVEVLLLLSLQAFLNSVRAYINPLVLASRGCKEVQTSGLNPTFTIRGKLSYRIGSLLPQENEHPKFAQLFFHDTENQVQNRVSHLTNLHPDVVGQLQNTLHEHNSYIQAFELTRLRDVQLILHADKHMKPSNEHYRKYNLPVSSEVAALVPDDCLHVILHCREGGLHRISTLHRSYDPLYYVIPFPNGADGLKRTTNQTLTAADFYAFCLQV